MIPRELTFLVEPEIQQRQAWYVAPDGHLITTRLMAGFQSFFRENSESWVERFQYKEAGPQLLLQAFLQRVVNAGGRIEREYGVGRRRMDLAVIWRLPGAAAREQRVVIECKILHAGVNATINEGLPQTVAYMDTWAAEEGHLVLFDRSPDRTWTRRFFAERRNTMDARLRSGACDVSTTRRNFLRTAALAATAPAVSSVAACTGDRTAADAPTRQPGSTLQAISKRRWPATA